MGHEEQAVLLSMGRHVLAGLRRGRFPISCRGAVGSGRNPEFLQMLCCIHFFFLINVVENPD